MSAALKAIQQSISTIKEQIVNHAVYQVIDDLDDLKIFMQYHVYAVWDFMSLLKSLQIKLTCTTTPWYPVGSGNTRAFINEIVAGEESDIDLNGDKKSHFEMYLDAMEQIGADTEQISSFLEALQDSGDFQLAYQAAKTPLAAQQFVDFTFQTINSGKAHTQASTFTFGREDLIPQMFLTMVNDLNQKFPTQLSKYKYYLDRHIEVDGDHHSHLALAMTADLCKDDEVLWNEAEAATVEALKRRIVLWDGALAEILKLKKAINADLQNG